MIKKFDSFVNEGIFKSEYKDIVDKIYNYILKMDVDLVDKLNDGLYKQWFSFTIKRSENLEADPFGEENWRDDIEIKLEKEYGFEFDVSDMNKFRLFINGDKVKATWLEARKLYRLLYKRIKEDEKYKKIENEKESKDRIKKVVI